MKKQLTNKDFEKILLETVLNNYKSDYAKINSKWEGIESKAQSVAAIAGIFIAATGSIIVNIELDGDTFIKILLITVIFLLVLSIISASLVLLVRKVNSSNTGHILEEMVNDIVQHKSLNKADLYYADFLRDQIKIWRFNIDNYETKYLSKVIFLIVAQYLLFSVQIVFALMVTNLILIH